MNRSTWRVLQWLAFPLFVLAILLSLPNLLMRDWAPRVGKWLASPFMHCRDRANGWLVLGGVRTKGAANTNRRVRR